MVRLYSVMDATDLMVTMCGECCDKYGYDKPDYKYSDEVDEVWDKEKTFKQNVLDYRTKTYGTPDLITTFIPLSNK